MFFRERVSPAGECSSLPRQIEAAAFFTRETDVTSGIVRLSPRGNRPRLDPSKCSVMPISYVLPKICLRGPQLGWSPQIWPHLPAFLLAESAAFGI
jgi:hypothetical protein